MHDFVNKRKFISEVKRPIESFNKNSIKKKKF